MAIAEHTEENSYARNISSFLDWAHKRLNEEVKQNEELEKEFGTADWVKKERQTKDRFRDNNEAKAEVIASIDKMRDCGYSLKLACSIEEISKTTYARYRVELGMDLYEGKEESK